MVALLQQWRPESGLLRNLEKLSVLESEETAGRELLRMRLIEWQMCESFERMHRLILET